MHLHILDASVLYGICIGKAPCRDCLLNQVVLQEGKTTVGRKWEGGREILVSSPPTLDVCFCFQRRLPILNLSTHLPFLATKAVTPNNGNDKSKIMSTATAPAPTAAASGTTNVGGANAAAVFKRLHPASYLSRFLSSGYRPDGRPILPSSSFQSTASASASAADDVWRQVSINTGSISTAHGSALVRMGDTTMVCGVKAEVGEPDAEAPGEGFVGEFDLFSFFFLFLLGIARESHCSLSYAYWDWKDAKERTKADLI